MLMLHVARGYFLRCNSGAEELSGNQQQFSFSHL
jgi:hypothetical protein